MPDTSALGAALPLVVAVALLLVPGLAMLRIAGLRGLLAAALAPACSTAVLGLGAILAGLVGVRWSIPVALAVVALGLGGALLVRVLTHPPAPDPATSWGDRVAIGGGLLLAVVPTVAAAGSVDAYLQRWDGVFHSAALRLIEQTGSASSLTLGALSYGDGRASIYPAGWHALASLLPGSPTAVLNIGATVPAAVGWVLGCAALAVQLGRRSRTFAAPGLAGTAGVLAGLVTATPMSLWVGWGHIPNAAALAMMPGAVALGLRLAREREGRAVGVVVIGVAALGMGLTHPNAVLASGALLLPALAAAVVRSSRARAAAGRTWAAVVVPLVAVGVVVVGVSLFLLSPLAASVTGYTGGSTQSVLGAVGDVVIGRYRLWPSNAGIVVGLLALVGAVIAAGRRDWVGPAMLAIAWLLYLDAATGGHLHLAALWYTSPARLSVVVAAVAVPLAATALVEAADRARRRVPRWAPVAAAAVLVVLVAIPSWQVRTTRTAAVYDDEPGHPPQFVTTGELAMIAELPGLVDGTVLGSPFAGTASAYGLVGIDVVFPVAGQVWSADQQLVMDHLEEIAAGTAEPEVCAAVGRLDIGYLYQDDVPYQDDNRYEPLDTLEVAGAEVLAEADTARVLVLPPCG